jgi:hypothetical protein
VSRQNDNANAWAQIGLGAVLIGVWRSHSHGGEGQCLRKRRCCSFTARRLSTQGRARV